MDIPTSLTNIGAGVFQCKHQKINSGLRLSYDTVYVGCSSLSSVDIPTSVTAIGDATFFGILSTFISEVNIFIG